MKKVATILLITISLMLIPSPTQAVTYYIDDDFNDTTQVDLSKTTAEVDTKNGWVVLSRKNAGGAIGLYKDSYDITVVNGDKVETYSFNGASMAKTDALSVNSGLTDPISVSIQSPGEYVVLDQGEKEASYYNYDGTSMFKNPFLSVSGLIRPLDVAVKKGTLDYAILDIDGDSKKVAWYSFDGSDMVLNDALSINVGHDSNPVSLAIQGDNYEYAVVDKAKKQVKYYSLDGGSIAENPSMSITNVGELTDPKSVSISQDDFSYAVVDGNDVKMYQYDGTGMQLNSFLSVSGLIRPLAVAIKPGSYDYAVLHYDILDNLIVSYYAFDGTAMEKIDEITVTGIDDFAYGNNQVLIGKVIPTVQPVLGLKLQADVELPAGTSISWEASVDGGNTWLPITNNGPSVRFAAGGNQPTYRSTLHTDDPNVTPKILNVKLIDSSLCISGMRVTNIVGPEINENPALPASFPPTTQVHIWAGYNVTIDVDTSGEAQTLVATITAGEETINLSSVTGDFIPADPLDSYNNTWIATFHTRATIPVGTLLDINLTAGKEGEFEHASYISFAVLEGSALLNHPIHLTH